MHNHPIHAAAAAEPPVRAVPEATETQYLNARFGESVGIYALPGYVGLEVEDQETVIVHLPISAVDKFITQLMAHRAMALLLDDLARRTPAVVAIGGGRFG